MAISPSLRGGSPVGYLSDLPAVEAGAVRYLRLWCDGSDMRPVIPANCHDLAGQDEPQVMQSFDLLCGLLMHNARRPLMRHQPGCECLGADEACFANFVAAAGEGHHEDAMLIATILVRADMAQCLVGLAETFAAALKRLDLRTQSWLRQAERTKLN